MMSADGYMEAELKYTLEGEGRELWEHWLAYGERGMLIKVKIRMLESIVIPMRAEYKKEKGGGGV